MGFITENPGMLYVVATLLPLASFVILLLLGGLRNAARPYKDSGFGRKIFWAMGGEMPTKVGAYIATGAIGLSCVLCLIGLVWFLNTHPLGHEGGSAAATHAEEGAEWAGRVTFARVG